MPFGFGANSTHADDRVKMPAANLAHAVLDPETPLAIWISRVGSFVDQCSHPLLCSNARLKSGAGVVLPEFRREPGEHLFPDARVNRRRRR